MNGPPQGLTVRILSGGRAGTSRTVAGPTRIGRGADADLRLHPELDLHASVHHAEIRTQGGRWTLRDLQSSNGTWLNGTRLRSETPLADGDHIQFGLAGPEALVHFADATPATQLVRALHRTADGEGTGSRWGALGFLIAGLLLIGALSVWQQARWSRERGAVLAAMDSSLAVYVGGTDSLELRVTGLAERLGESRAEVEHLQQALADSEAGSHDEVARLRAALDVAHAELERRSRVAALDFRAIQDANRAAVTLVYAEDRGGSVAIGTGFAVHESGVIASNLHVVQDASGVPATRIGVQFTGSDQVWPARIVDRDREADLVLLQIDNLLGTVPVVKGFNPDPSGLEVVAMMGFPRSGNDPSDPARGPTPNPMLTAGVVLARSSDTLEILGYGAPGASGTAVFDGDGHVVGIVYGGRGVAAPTLLATPVAELQALLAATHPGPAG